MACATADDVAALLTAAPPISRPTVEARPVDEAEIVRIVQKHAASAVDASSNFGSLGLDSIEVMAVARDLREETGVDVDLTDVLAVDSVAELATLSRRKASRDDAAAAPRPSPFPSAFDRPWPGGRDEERYDAPSRYFRDGRAKRTDSARPGEPSLLYRLGFTLLSFVVGIAIPIVAVVPLLRIEKFLGARYGLIPKVYILVHRCGLPNIEAFVALWGASWSLEGHGDRLPGDGVLAFDRGWVPSLYWCYVFVVEYSVVGSLYYLTWTFACRANSVALKWLVVGKQRPGTFPIWTSATGFRSALFMNAVDCSLKQLWTALDHWHPSPLQALYLRAYGARVGKRVTFAGAIPIGLVEESGYDLVDIGDDVTFECHSILLPSRLETTTSVVHGHVRIMRGARLGFAAEVGEGVVVGENAVVGALARASKMCPPGAYYTSSGLVLRGDLPRDRYGDVVEPPGCCDTTLRVPRRRGGLGVFHASLPLLSWMLLVPAVSAAASAPFAFTLLRHGLSWRLSFHVVFFLCAPCWCVAAVVRFFKWFLDMPAKGDERTLTPAFVAYAGLVQNWACLGQVLGCVEIKQ
jgi:acyl carrier protein